MTCCIKSMLIDNINMDCWLSELALQKSNPCVDLVQTHIIIISLNLFSTSFPHSWPITVFVPRLTWRVPLEEQELLIPPEHLSSRPVFNGVRVSFMCKFCKSLFVVLYFFLLATVLSVLLWYMNSDCPFGIFKLFLFS